MGLKLGRMAGIAAKKKPTGLQQSTKSGIILTPLFSAVVVIAGTTAVGKTDLSLELARRLNGEVVSADSVQVCLM